MWREGIRLDYIPKRGQDERKMMHAGMVVRRTSEGMKRLLAMHLSYSCIILGRIQLERAEMHMEMIFGRKFL